MAGSAKPAVGSVADELFDKYLLPKLALTIILAASLAGTAVSVGLTGRWAGFLIAAKWGYFVALGVLTGGLVWQHGFVRPADLATGAERYCERMYRRFDRIGLAAAGVLAATGLVVLARYRGAVGELLVGVVVVSVLGLVALIPVTAAWTRPADARFRHPAGLLAVALALLAVASTALAEVALGGGDLTEALVRVLHLGAFALWLGGAVWNIFVAVPTGQRQPTVPVIRAAGQQLERFRWAVRLIIPTLLLTGGYQAVAALGYRPATYVGSGIGLLVLAKLGFVVLLVGIFLTCPMWRACSPIDGVCDLAELDSTADGPEEVRATADD